jgi:hypothetical protein
VGLRFIANGREFTSSITVPPKAQYILADIVAQMGGTGTGVLEVQVAAIPMMKAFTKPLDNYYEIARRKLFRCWWRMCCRSASGALWWQACWQR